MTISRPLGCLYTISSTTVRRNASQRVLRGYSARLLRQYAQPAQRQNGVTATPLDPVKSALTIIESRAKVDPVNAPRSTLPPPLSLPTRGDEAAPVYWYRIGRAYGTFYKDGIKAVWFNYKATRLLKTRMKDEHHVQDITSAVIKKAITRSEFQLLARNSHDIGKLPIFSLLVLVFGEWLVLIVPFVPNRVPGTCRIPKQVRGMRLKAEERRRISFRQGITEPSKEQLGGKDTQNAKAKNKSEDAWPLVKHADSSRRMLRDLRDDQLFHLSSTLGLHSGIWDRVQLTPPAFLLRRAISTRLQYIARDDYLLLENGGASRLTSDELHIACEQRGIDILGKKDERLREDLAWWLKRQQEDAGRGRALLTMLFRRPNAWMGRGKD